MLRINPSGFSASAVILALSGLCCASTLAQQPKQYTSQDYAAAERFMSYNVNPLAWQGVVHAQSLGDGRFWYRDAGQSSIDYILLDPAKGTRTAAFDQVKLAAALH